MNTEKLTRNINFLVILSLLFILTGCSIFDENLKKSDKNISALPISEVHERLGLNLEQTIEHLTQVLEKHQFRIEGGFTSDYRFSTNSIKIQDMMCQGQYLKNAPLPCDIKIHGMIIPKNENVTYVRILYKESCLDIQYIESTCKDSNAENLLFAILKDLQKK